MTRLPARLGCADRKSLLLGTALASTLLIAVVAAPAPAHAVVDCLTGAPASPAPLFNNEDDSIVCVNTETRIGSPYGISMNTYNDNHDVAITNSGAVGASGAGNTFGIEARTNGNNSAINIVNTGDIDTSSSGLNSYAIYASNDQDNSSIRIENDGNLTVNVIGGAGDDGYGIHVRTDANNNPIDIVNRGDINVVTDGLTAYSIGINVFVAGGLDSNPVTINNSGDMMLDGGADAAGISIRTLSSNGDLNVVNSGDIVVIGQGALVAAIADGISVVSQYAANSSVSVVNTGDLTVTGGNYSFAINAVTRGAGSVDSTVTIDNEGDLTVVGGRYTLGIYAYTSGDNGAVNINNRGDISVSLGNNNAYGIRSRVAGANSNLSIFNSGDIAVTAPVDAFGIYTRSLGGTNSAIDIVNRGDVTVAAGRYARGIDAITYGDNSPLSIDNSGDIALTGGVFAFGMAVVTYGENVDVSVANSGDVTAAGGLYSVGLNINARGSGGSVGIVNSGDISATGSSAASAAIVAVAPYGAVRVENSGTLYAQSDVRALGIYALSNDGATIINSGEVSASSLFAIDVNGTGSAEIYNSGTITGFVDLTEQDDNFVNQSGGLFDARLTSDFGDGEDHFTNEAGAIVRALNIGNTGTRFDGLERFENRGTISMVDGAEGDSFTIANLPGGTGVTFSGSGASRLAVDAFLGAPGSTSDTLTIEGDVSGRTELTVNNTNPGGGALNRAGIPVVFATGETPDEGAFFLEAPIDTGFFDYDLFFVPTGSGRWELRSALGSGALVLPQLVTASQDMWHQGASVWFDRSADLRVLLAGGPSPATSDLGTKSLSAPQSDGLTPAVWVRGSGGWLNRDSNARSTSSGRSLSVALDRDLETMDFQMGLDLGTRDLLSQGDILVFGMLGGYVHGDLDYGGLGRDFDFTGGQVGAYATYLKGGLFVDTLLNVHLTELDANGALGFPNNDLGANTLGLRTDAGYRFGSFSGGAFLEPLATIAVTWADIDGFSLGGNTVKFDDEANLRGRLGLRAGTTMEAWEGTRMEPFVIGSLWGTLSGDNQATLTSGGSTFRLEDQLNDVWGEVSAGVNFFNFSETTSVFAKVDVTFGDDVSGVGGKAGMRVAW